MANKKRFYLGSENTRPRILPNYNGYTIDVKLRQFRKVEYGKPIEYIPFNSEKGIALLQEMNEEGIDYNPLTKRLERI